MSGFDDIADPRSRTASRKRRRRVVLGVAAAAVALPAGVAISPLGGSGSAMLQAAAGAAGLDLASIMAARSPGSRAPGALYQTKHAREHAPRHVPGRRHAVPPPAVAEGTVPGAYAPIESMLPPAEVALVPSFESPVGGFPATGPSGIGGGGGFVPIAIGGGGGGGIIGGGGGGGGGVIGGGGGGGYTPPGPVAAVPEPATWLTMILGFAGIGCALRRRRRRERGAAILDVKAQTAA